MMPRVRADIVDMLSHNFGSEARSFMKLPFMVGGSNVDEDGMAAPVRLALLQGSYKRTDFFIAHGRG